MSRIALALYALLAAACESPSDVLRPVIYPDNVQAGAAMRDAPLIVLVRIKEVTLVGRERRAPQPGQASSSIPLRLARIGADVLATVRGQADQRIEFYSWIWNSGKHGGPRLFVPNVGGIRLMFLRSEGRYLHTVGDYPSYDLELRERWLPALLASWKPANGDDPLRRFVAARLQAELGGLTEQQLHEDFGDDGPRVNHHWVLDRWELVRVVGPLSVASELDALCLHGRNSAVRFAACWETAQYFPGRCAAYQIALQAGGGLAKDLLFRHFASCKQSPRHRVGMGSLEMFFGFGLARENRRESLRVFASAMDAEVRSAACGLASTMPETRDLSECGTKVRERR